MGGPRDDRDRQLLALLQADAWLTYAALGERVHLSASAVQRRVERLIADGTLRGARAEVETAPHSGLTVYLLAELVDDSAGTIRRVADALCRAPEVRDAHYVTGEADVILKLELDDMAHYDRFIAAHVNNQSAIRRFKTFASLRPLAGDEPGDRRKGLDSGARR
jgi:DNA-binding Lrp family transcriptional regulator